MSVDEWRTKFVDFSKESLLKYKGSATDKEYFRSLVSCIDIFTGQSSGDLFTIQTYYPEYGAAILTSEVISDPLTWKLFIVGLDNWEFTVDSYGRDNSICNGNSAFLSCGDVPKDKITKYLSQVDHELKKAESKRSIARHSSNADGGFQRTPGFVRSTCIRVLCSPDDSFVSNGVAAPKMTPECSGFTDVGMHTGCNPRDTMLSLVLSILKVTLKNGMIPPLAIADHCYTRFVVEYYLGLATELKQRTKLQRELTKVNVNLLMNYLKVVSRYISTQSFWHVFWPDFLPMVEKECSSIRKYLEETTTRQARVDSERFKITLPNFTDLRRAYSPTLLLSIDQPAVKASDKSFSEICAKSKLNLDWVPIPVIQSLNDCKRLIENAIFAKNDAYTFSTVYVSIGMFLLQLARDHLSSSSSKKSSQQLSLGDIEVLIDVCDKYIVKLRGFTKDCGAGIGGLLSNELLSHEVLIGWLKFCLLFKTCCDHYSILSKFCVPLHYTDLEHLVLKDRWAWDLLDLICEFLRQHLSKGSLGVVFSGRNNEMNDMFKLADHFVATYSTEYDTLWKKELNDANERIKNRWRDIEVKKAECRKIRDDIDSLRQNITKTRCQRNSHAQHIKNAREMIVTNPEWTALNSTMQAFELSLRYKEVDLENAKQPPAYLKQPLPRGAFYGKRSLFFIHMPRLLRHTWTASFQAQEMLFTNGTCMAPPGSTCDFHSYYNNPVPYRNAKNAIGTPLALFIAIPPAKYGTENVENISDRTDGVWYQNEFHPSLVRTSQKNPFVASRKDAVERFCEPVAHEWKWTANQPGFETPKDRCNLTLSKLYSKPVSMQREQFLTLGNLRSCPLHQLFHLLNAIEDTSLPCHDKFFQTTHTVVRQVLYHIGEIQEFPSTKFLQKLWKWGIEHDQSFMNTFRKVLVDALDRVKEASKNENEFFIYLEIVSFFSQFDSNYLDLMDQCSDIACGWADRMEVEIQNARDRSQAEIILQAQKRRHSFLLYALISYEMLVILPDYNAHKKRIGKIIELRLLISSSKPEKLSEKATNIWKRIYFFLSRIYPVFQKDPSSWNELLTSTIKKVLPSYVDSEMKWSSFENSYCFWTKTNAGNYLSLNIMNGIVLVNGLPPSLLPLNIRRNKLFCRVFGEIDFEVTIGGDGVHHTQNPVKDRYYSFHMRGNELLIYEEHEDKKLLLLDANASTSWSKHIPIGMTALYSHWLYLDKNIVLFRPVAFQDRTVYYILNSTGLYKVPRQYRGKSASFIDSVVSTFDKFLAFDQKISAILAFFCKFEQKEYIHPFLTNENVLKIFLVRYQISFELKEDSTFYDCSDFGEFKLRAIQQFDDKMYKFYDYLIMEKDSGEQKVIFPQGQVTLKNNIVSIERPTLGVIDEISFGGHHYNTFTVHNQFCHLQSKDILSGLQLAAVQAATSTCLPEKGTSMTGYEMAIRQIRKCWVNSPLRPDEQSMLKSLLDVTDLPPALVIIVHQLITDSFRLAFLYKDSSRCDLNLNAFMKALNEYNLPLQPHNSARNFRLSLSFDEMCMAGVSRSQNHVYSMTNQPNALNDNVAAYQRKKADISSYENALCTLISEEKRKDAMEFPLKNLPVFKNKVIGDHMVDKLDRSHKHYSRLPHLKCHSKQKQKLAEETLINLHNSIESEEQEMHKLILDRLYQEMQCSSSFEFKTILIEKAANEIPSLTISDLVEATWQPNSLLNFNPILSEQDVKELCLMIIDWMQFYVLRDRIQRIQKHFQSNEIDRALLELSVRRKFNPYRFPKWLAFEFDQGLQIRPDQATILDDILSKNGSVTQLNMGLGKTRVIVPCLILELSKRKNIPRVYLLSSLLDEGYDYLHLTLTGGVFAKKLFRFPFNRDIKLDPEKTTLLRASLKYCERVQGAAILAPEHTLSHFLKGFELALFGQDSITTKITEVNKFNFADIYDEVDEIMRPNQELVYAEGAPKTLESGSRRWNAVFAVLFSIRHHPGLLHFFEKSEISDFKSKNVSVDQFNGFRLRPGKLLETKRSSMIGLIATSLFSNVRSGDLLDWTKTPLRLYHDLASSFEKAENANVEADSVSDDEINGCRLRSGKLLEKETKSVARETSELLFCNVMSIDFPESSIDWMKKPLDGDLKERITDFVTDCSQSSDIVCDSEFFSPELFQDLLILRGLLAHDVLVHCLKLRFGVDYGIVPNHKTLMAIPFQAANLPKLRSEFAQPDIAIILTVLSYYNVGLNREQVIETITELLSAGKSVQRRVYKEVFKLCKKANDERVRVDNDVLLTIDTIEKLDVKNEVQVNLLYNMYRKNMIFINFWLANVLFPTATMIFPKKLTASSWNLTDSRNSSLRCGFSGTDDACLFLPDPLLYDPPDDPSLLATNGKMLEHLLKKATYCSLQPIPVNGKAYASVDTKALGGSRVLADHTNNINESILLNKLVSLVNVKNADAFIDAGALLCNHPMDEVANFFLSRINGKFKGVVYFSTKERGWRVIDRKPCDTSLKSSSILESDAFVIFDQSRCRGADMKLRPKAKAILSIGPSQQKDSLMQAAGRLRQLDFGQTIIAMATPNVELSIKDCLGLSKKQNLTMEHVVSYALFNSVEATGISMKHWCSQGMRFLHLLNNPKSILEEELSDLESLYFAPDEQCTLSNIVIPKLQSIQVDCPKFCKTSAAVLNRLKETVGTLGIDVSTNYVAGFEECERELEQEREKESEKEKELPQMSPFIENDWDYSKVFTLDTPRNINFIDKKPWSATRFFSSKFLSDNSKAIGSSVHWKVSKIYLTRNFLRPLAEDGHYDDYLRPVRMILFFPKNAELLVVSEREAENLWRCLLLGKAKVQQYSPILCGINFLSTGKTENSSGISLISSPSNLSSVSHAALSLFRGQTSFQRKDQDALENKLLRSREAASGASFFCNSRGFRSMYQGSDLENACNNVLQFLHEKNKSE